MSTTFVQTDRFKRAMTVAREIGLTKQERYELARMIPTTPSDFDGSWKGLDEAQLEELISMMTGYILIRWLAFMRPPESQGALMP